LKAIGNVAIFKSKLQHTSAFRPRLIVWLRKICCPNPPLRNLFDGYTMSSTATDLKRCSASETTNVNLSWSPEHGVPALSMRSLWVGISRRRPGTSKTSWPILESDYRFESLGKAARILAIPAAHHRFNYIHPFPDGNGRVSRLMSHAMAHRAGIAAHGLWSISRGLARGLESRGEYKRMMDHADMPRQGDLDGRGNLSQYALSDFVSWFLRVCLDQVTFMSGLFQIDTLARRLRRYVEHNDSLKPEAARLLEETLIRGEIERGDVPRIMGLPERTARRVFNDVVAAGLLASETPKGPVSLRFPARL
jgi:hypothetical protein